MTRTKANYNAPTGEDVPVEIVSEGFHGALPVTRIRILEDVPSLGGDFVKGAEFDCPSMRITNRRKID